MQRHKGLRPTEQRDVTFARFEVRFGKDGFVQFDGRHQRGRRVNVEIPVLQGRGRLEEFRRRGRSFLRLEVLHGFSQRLLRTGHVADRGKGHAEREQAVETMGGVEPVGGPLQVGGGGAHRFDPFAIDLLLGLAEVDDSQDVWNRAHEIGIAIVERVQLGSDAAGLDGGFGVIAVFEAFEGPRKRTGGSGRVSCKKYQDAPAPNTTIAPLAPITGHLKAVKRARALVSRLGE